jgi:glucose/arabinose dehydrogenase
MRRAALLVVLVAAVSLAACSDGRTARGARRTTTTAAPAAPTSTGATSPTSEPDPCAVTPVNVGGPSGMSTYVSDAQFATALAWAPDGRLFVAERAGAVRVFDGRTVTTIAQLPAVTTERGGGYSERGLLGLALSPSFASDHLVYAFYSASDFVTQVVVRMRECRGVASSPETIITLPAGNDCCHKGGRLAFGPDGMLYVTLGDLHTGLSGAAQDVDDPRGKILRYRPDGSVPPDNPFGANDPVWATGLRNTFGIAFGPNNAVFVTVNGPTGDAGTPATGYDLAFSVVAGGRYQWPFCYGYSHQLSGVNCGGRPDPDWSSEERRYIPTGATYVSAAGPTAFANHFVFCTFDDGMLVFTPGSPHATVQSGPSACRLDVKEGPDHAMYFSSESAIVRFA